MRKQMTDENEVYGEGRELEGIVELTVVSKERRREGITR